MTGLEEWLRARRPVQSYALAWALLVVVAVGRSCFWPFQVPRADREIHLTLLGLAWLPDGEIGLLASAFLRFVVVAGGVLWLFRRFTPWSSWATALAFFVDTSIEAESNLYMSHLTPATAVLLLVFAAWWHASSDELPNADWRTLLSEQRILPRWVHVMSVGYLGTIYSWSGMSKLITSGPSWADGLSLQLYFFRFAPPSWFRSLLLENVELAWLAQASVFGAELLAVVGVVHRKTRLVTGTVLLSFHIISELTFGLGFFGNVAAVSLLLVADPAWSLFVRKRRSGPAT